MVEIINGVHSHAVFTVKVQKKRVDGVLIVQYELGQCESIVSKHLDLRRISFEMLAVAKSKLIYNMNMINHAIQRNTLILLYVYEIS